MKALVRNFTGKTIQWRGFGHSVNCRILWIEIFCARPLLKSPLLLINLKKFLGTPAGCPWDTWHGTNTCLPAGVPGISRSFTIEKLTAGTPASPRDARPSREFSGVLCDLFLMCLFSGRPRFGSVRLRFGDGTVQAVPVFGFFCISVQFNRKGRFRFRFRFLENGSGGSGSAVGFGKNGSDGSGFRFRFGSWATLYKPWFPNRDSSPLPNISTNFGHSHSPPKIPPNRQEWGPQNEFPGVTRTKGFCGNSTETLIFQEFPGPSRFRILGSPFSAFWGEMKLICWAVLSDSRLLAEKGLKWGRKEGTYEVELR